MFLVVMILIYFIKKIMIHLTFQKITLFNKNIENKYNNK